MDDRRRSGREEGSLVFLSDPVQTRPTGRTSGVLGTLAYPVPNPLPSSAFLLSGTPSCLTAHLRPGLHR